MPTAMRCWTKTANDGHKYTTCDGNQGKKSNTKSRKKRRQRRPATPQLGDDTHEMPSSRPVVSKQVNNLFVSLPSLTGIVGNVASLLNMKSDAEMSSFVKKKSRPPTSFNQFGDDAEFRSRVDVAPRTMGTRATRIPSPEIFKDTRDEWNADMPSEEVRGMEGFKDYQESTDYSSSDDDEEETKVTKFEFEGVLYYRDEDNVLYNPETSEIVGRLEGGSIDFTYGDDPDYESSEDEEVITGDIADLNEEEISDDEAPDPFIGDFNNIMGRSLTGLTPAQMNALDPAVLFGMLPTSVASQVVLNPQITGVKVGRLSAKEIFNRGFVSDSSIRYLKQLEEDGAWEELPKEMKRLVYSGRPMLKKGTRLFMSSNIRRFPEQREAIVTNVGKKKITFKFPFKKGFTYGRDGVVPDRPEFKVLLDYEEVIKEIGGLDNGREVIDEATDKENNESFSLNTKLYHYGDNFRVFEKLEHIMSERHVADLNEPISSNKGVVQVLLDGAIDLLDFSHINEGLETNWGGTGTIGGLTMGERKELLKRFQDSPALSKQLLAYDFHRVGFVRGQVGKQKIPINMYSEINENLKDHTLRLRENLGRVTGGGYNSGYGSGGKLATLETSSRPRDVRELKEYLAFPLWKKVEEGLSRYHLKRTKTGKLLYNAMIEILERQ